MTISYVWPRVPKQNDGFNEIRQIKAVTVQLFTNLFKVSSVRQTEFHFGDASEALVNKIHSHK